MRDRASLVVSAGSSHSPWMTGLKVAAPPGFKGTIGLGSATPAPADGIKGKDANEKAAPESILRLETD
jgi:hypothetical protein